MITFNPTHLAMLDVRPSARQIDQFINDAIDAFLDGYAVGAKPTRKP